jgi:peptide deformylase
MAILKVARMGNPVLRRVADPIPVDNICTPETRSLIQDMLETVHEYDGLGLAAPQVHRSVRLVLLALDAEEGFEVWINPVLSVMGEEAMTTTEGCLSVPDLRGDVTRPGQVRVQALDQNAEAVDKVLDGFPAVVAQHECDHLDGVLFVDRVDTRTLAFLPEYRRYGRGTDLDDEVPE